MSELSIVDFVPAPEGDDVAAVPEVLGLRTRHFLVDSSVYIRFHLQFHGPVWADLQSAIARFGLHLHTNDLILHEVGKWLLEQAGKLVREYEALHKNAEGWNRRKFGDVALPEVPEVETIAKAARLNFSRSLAGMGVVEHDLAWADMEVLLKRYMRREPPFAKAKSKEFPDAAIVDAARVWAERNGELLYILSDDEAMLAHAESVDGLIPVPGLAEFLKLVAQAQQPEVTGALEEIENLQEFDDALFDALNTALDSATYRYLGSRYDDGYVDAADMMSLDLLRGWTVTAVEGPVVSFLLNVGFGVRLDAVFSSVRVDEEGEPVDLETDLVTFGETMSARVYIRLDREAFAITKLEILGDLIFDDPDSYEE